MARRRSRRSRGDSFVNRATVWLIALVVLLAAVSFGFETSPGLGFFLFVVLPVTAAIGTAWFQRRARQSAKRDAAETYEAARREAAKQARLRIETAWHIGALLTGSGLDFELAVADVLAARGYDLRCVGGSGDRGVETHDDGWSVPRATICSHIPTSGAPYQHRRGTHGCLPSKAVSLSEPGLTAFRDRRR